MSSVLVGVDGSAASRRAVEWAARTATAEGLPLIVAHVIPWSRYSFQTPSDNAERHTRRNEELAAATSQLVEPLTELATQNGASTRSLVRHGNPVDTLLDIVPEEGVGLVVVGRTGDTSLRDKVFGGTAQHLAHTCPVPLVVIP